MSTQPGGADGAATGGGELEGLDWEAAERSDEFRELVARKRRFVLPATIFFLGWFFGFVLLCGYAPDFMGEEFLADGLTVGYVLAFTQFIMVWALCWMYLRVSDRVFDPLAEKAARKAAEAGRGGGRFERSGAPEHAPGEVTSR